VLRGEHCPKIEPRRGPKPMHSLGGLWRCGSGGGMVAREGASLRIQRLLTTKFVN
jgi:hypothetical protein